MVFEKYPAEGNDAAITRSTGKSESQNVSESMDFEEMESVMWRKVLLPNATFLPYL